MGLLSQQYGKVVELTAGSTLCTPTIKVTDQYAICFTHSNPRLTSGSSYIIIENGLYVSGGTTYVQGHFNARCTIKNDHATTLKICGGCDSNKCTVMCGKTFSCGDLSSAGVVCGTRFKSTSRLWHTSLLCCNNFFADSGASGGDGFALGQGTGILDIWVKDDSVSELRSVLRANNQGNCIVIGRGCSANDNANIPVYVCESLSVSQAADYQGIAIGCNYTNIGGWNSQLNMYGTSHSVFRINHGAGTNSANNAQTNCIFAHVNNPFVMLSSGNIRLCGQDTVCITGKGVACTCFQTPILCAPTCVRSACVHSTGNICGSEICAGSWFRTGTAKGLYNSGTGVHWYSVATNNMRLYPGSANNISLEFYSCAASRACINVNCDNQLQMYDSGGSVRFIINSNTDIRLCNTTCLHCNVYIGGIVYACTQNESLNFKGARGCFTNQYMHLYNKVGIGHPSGWGCGETNTPDKGLSTYGAACIGYGCTGSAGQLIVNGGVTTTGGFGLKSGSYGINFYPDHCAFWNIVAGGSSSNSGIRFRDSGGNIDGYVYADGGHIGFLDQASHWAYGHKNDTCHWWNINNNIRMKLDTDTLHICGAGTCARLIMYGCNMVNGYFYANCNRDVGILDADGNWAIRHRRDTGTYWSINNTDEMCLTTTCLCHSNVICAAGCLRAPTVCATGCVTAPNVYSNGASMTSVAQGLCFWREFMVCGDADTFYPVCYFRGNTFGYKRYSINRSYNSTAPNTWYTSTHKGGLNYTWEQTTDTQWGGNDRSFRVNQVRETYTTVIGGHVHTVSGGVVLLRGGGALYCFASDAMCRSCVCVYDGAGGTDSKGMTHSSCTYFCPGNCACVCALTCANAQSCRNSTICNTSAYPLQMQGVGNSSATTGCFCVVRSSGHLCAANSVCGPNIIGSTCVTGPVLKATNCVYTCCGIDFVHSNWTGEKTKIQAHSTHLYFQNYNSGCFFFRNCHGTNIVSIACDGCLRTANCLRVANNICSDLGISGQSYVRSPGYLQTGNHIYAWSQTQNCTTFGIGNAAGNAWIHPLKVCRCGTVVIDNGSNNSSLDAALFICQTSNSDWAQIICKNSGSATDYGLDVRVGASAGYAYYARFNNCVRFIVRYDCLCHNTMICSPAIKASSYMNSGKFCAGSAYLCNGCLYVNGAVCSTTGFYGDGSNLTGVGGGLCGSTGSANGSCTTLGYCALPNGTGSGNVAIGFKAMQATTSGTFNTASGYRVMCCNTTGHNNTAFGMQALFKNTTGFRNTAIGVSALYNNTASSNTAVGGCAMQQTTTGSQNTALGVGALYATTSAQSNTSSGYQSAYATTTGNNNTTMGSHSLRINTTGYDNVALGYYAMYGNTTGNSNVAVGKQALQCITTGYRNVAIGDFAMGFAGCDPHSNVVIGNGAGMTPTCCRGCNGYCYNTFIGRNAGDGTFNGTIGGSACTGDCNVFIGAYTGGSPHNGKNNVLIGTNSGYNMQCGASCNVFIGHGSGGAVTTGCKCVVIGYGYGGCYQNASICAACTHVGTLNKSSGSFIIPHPDPAKTATTDLRHSYVESPTRGDNIYRWQVDVTNCCNVITLPSYYQFLNENDMVWVSPVEHFGSAYGKVTEDQCCAIICTNADGKYNVLLVGTRCDCMALNHWQGVEPPMESTSPALSAITEENPKGPDYPRVFVCNVRKPMSEW